MEKIKIPYGEADYKTLIEENYIYVDKTMYIEKLENYKKAVYVRPRRFGKSLFTSMISYYYDIKEKENFEKLFQGKYIYDHPTEKKNAYYILKFNFSGMNVSINKTAKEIEESFNDNVYISCRAFVQKYELDIEIEKNKVAATTLQDLLSQFQTLGQKNKIYIMIDEYDHFTNGMLEGNVDRFIKSLGQGGFVRAFYEVIKMFAEGTDSVVDRFFATGVAPLTLDSMTSGFNITTNISTSRNFTAMCGLTGEEVKQLVEKSGLSENVYEELKKNYDGYRFSKESEEHTFNVTLVMYYLSNYINEGIAPTNPVDSNLATTGNKIESIVNLMTPKENYNKLVELITTGEVSGELVRQFELNEYRFDENSFLSLLFYQGYITIKDIGFDVTFCVPNYISEVLYASYFTKLIDSKETYNVETEEITQAIKNFGKDGKIEPITKVISNFLTYQSVRDRENFTEKTLKYVYSLFFSLSSQYYVYGEFPSKQGFADIFIEKSSRSNSTYEAVIELKYLNKEKAKTANYDELHKEAIDQMNRYLEDKRLSDRENLKKFVIIFEGFDTYHVTEV